MSVHTLDHPCWKEQVSDGVACLLQCWPIDAVCGLLSTRGLLLHEGPPHFSRWTEPRVGKRKRLRKSNQGRKQSKPPVTGAGSESRDFTPVSMAAFPAPGTGSSKCLNGRQPKAPGES